MRKTALTLLSLLLAALPLAAQSTKKAPEKAAAPVVEMPKVEFEKYTLPNGLDVILHVDRKLPIVHVNEWFHVGSKNEKRGRTGFAHLFEHMMFQGSKNATEEYFVYAERAGANLREGGVNGTTSFDRTNYFVTAPAGKLDYLLWLESDRVATLDQTIKKEKLDNQRDVVKNERRQGLENTPYGRAFNLIFENLHPADHPYSWMVIGSHEDLTAASLEDVQEFFRRYYTPNNLSLVIAGDFDKDEAKKLVEKYFGSLPPGPALDRPQKYVPKLDGEKVVEAYDRVPLERTYIVWPAPQYFSDDEPKLDLASAILTDGLSSRLQKVLMYDNQLAGEVTSFNFAQEISGLFAVQVTARPGVDLAKIEQIVSDEIAKLAKSGPTAEELDRAKIKQRYNFITGLERIGGFGGKADLLNQYNTYLGAPDKFDEDIARYQAVTTADVREAVSKWMDHRNRLLVRFRPETSRRTDVQVDRTKAPDIGADRMFQPPAVKSAKLENGMSVFVVERNDLPKVAVTFATRAGIVADTNAKAGVAHMTMRTIDRGTKSRTALQIEDQLGNLGTGLSGSAGREISILSMDTLKSSLAPALDILADVVRNPQFPASEFDREKKLHLDSLKQEANNPNALAARIRPMLTFGAEHPYGRPARGLPATVEAISREDLQQFHANWWKPGSSAIVFAGDLSLDEAVALAKKEFGDWSGGSAPAATIPAPAPAQAGKIYVVDRPDAAQTVVSQALLAPARKSDDYYALALADAVWGGGGFGTRLNLNLREDKGYSYGVFSNQALYTHGGAWWASGGVQTNKTKESIVEFLKEMDAIAGQRPVTADELGNAKLTRVRGYAQQFESLGRIAGQVATLWAMDLPLSELQNEPQAITAASLDAVNAAAKRYAVPSKATLLLVGDVSKIQGGLEELKAGDLVVLDAEGKLVKR
ncbi:MAG: pitrilysin family protein [Thermoanaerobaculia bacterium]